MASRALPLLSLALLATPLFACTDEDGTTAPPEVKTGAYTAFLQRGWIIPTSSTEGRALGFDLDHDGSGDNEVGGLIGGLAGLGLDVDDANAALVGSGDSIIAHLVRADRRDDDDSVAWQLWNGTGTPPRFDGTDRVGPSAVDGALWGAITAGSLAAHWGDVVVRVPLFPGQPAVALPLTDAQLELVTDGPCRGRIGGTVLDLSLTIALEEIGRQTIVHLQAHPEHPFTTAAVSIIDENNDGTVTVAEVVSLARALLRADVDLDGDGAADGASFALGFECAPAQLASTPTF